MRFTARLQHCFVAGALAVVNQPRSQPPDQRMEPEKGLDQHMYSGGEVVAAADVAQFVREDGFQLGARQAVCYALGQQQHWAKDAENTWLE